MKKFIKLEINKEYEDEKSLLVDGVRNILDFKVREYESSLLSTMYECESPIEQIMAMELSDSMFLLQEEYNIVLMELENQKYLKANGKLYRVDFYLEFIFSYDKNKKDILRLVIECDGHEFHEKTKEQVKKDNERTRNLQKAGYDVLHFSGSEIYNDWYKCGKEIRDFVKNKYFDFCKKCEVSK